MAKDGSSKAKSADDHAAARKAAQLRKKRGHHGNGGQKDPNKQPVSLLDIARERREHQRQVEFRDRQRENTVAAVLKDIETLGAAVISRQSALGPQIIRQLKDRFRGTDVKWKDSDESCTFAKPKKAAKAS